MTQTITPESEEITRPRLDDAGRAVLFKNARTANNFSDRPVPEKQLKEIYELMKWGPTGDWHSLLVVNIGHPGKDPWFGRQPQLNYDEAVRHV
jgi:hypothetical protein